VDHGADGDQPLERLGGRVAVVVAGARRDEREPRTDRVQECPARRRGAAVVGDLEHVDPREPAPHQPGVDVLLGITGQQEAQPVGFAEQHDGDVVDPATRRRGCLGHALSWPDHGQRHLVEPEPRPGRQRAPWRLAVPQLRVPCLPRRPGPTHPRLEHPPHAVALEQAHQPRDVVLVRVAEHDDVDPAVPRGEPPVELDQQPLGVRAAVDQHSRAAPTLDQDRVALPDVEHHQPGRATRDVRERDGGDRHHQQRPAEHDPTAA
jgi:hypothetical protein